MTAQTTYPISSAADLSTAIGSVNGGNPADLQFSTNSIDLSAVSPLGTLQYSVTLSGSGYSSLDLNTDSIQSVTAALSSTALLEISPGYSVSLTGGGLFGQDGGGNGYAGNAVSVSAGSLNVDAGSNLILTGGAGSNSTGTGEGGDGGNAALTVSGAVSLDSASMGVTGGNGGDSASNNGGNGGSASASMGSLTVASSSGTGSLYVHGGLAGYNSGSAPGLSGNGGAAALAVTGAVSVDSGMVVVIGGEAQYGYGSAGTTEGSGGSASASLGSLTLTSNEYGSSGQAIGEFCQFTVEGAGTGNGDYLYGTGGAGGAAGLTVSGAVSMDASDLDVIGGNGGPSAGNTGGQGGNVSVSLGSLTLTSSAYGAGSIYMRGGGSGYSNGGTAGDAGSLNLSAGAVSIDSSDILLGGGNANFGSGSAGTTEGSGGGAWVSLGSLSLTSNGYYNSDSTGTAAYLTVLGGTGGEDKSLGNGGNGGDAGLTVSGAVSIDSSSLVVTGGAGNSNSSSSGAAGGDGGNASVSLGSLAMTANYSSAQVSIGGGAGGEANNGSWLGGNGGAATLLAGAVWLDSGSVSLLGGAGGNSSAGTGGNGGNAAWQGGSVTLNGASTLSLSGGSGGTGVTGGNGGDAFVTMGSLELADAACAVTVAGGMASSGGISGTAEVLLGALNGAGTFYLNGYGTSNLQVSSGYFSGMIAGNESLQKTGLGTLILSGDDPYTGGTGVMGGVLLVYGSGALGTGSVTVDGGFLIAANSGALGGGNLLVSGGVLGTDGVNHTIAVVGNYSQSSAGTLQIGLGGAAAGQFDVLEVEGTTGLSGALQLVSDGGFQVRRGESFEIVDSTGALTGQFGTVEDMIGGLALKVVYLPNGVLLEPIIPVYASLGTTANEKAAGAALDQLGNLSPSSPLVTFFDLNSSATASVPGYLASLSPASLTPLYQIGFGTAQVEALMVGGHLSQVFGDAGKGGLSWNGQGPLFAAGLPAGQEAAMSKDLEAQHWGGFVHFLGDFGTVSGDANAPGYQFSIGGVAAGVDYRFSKDFAAGLLLGYTQSDSGQSTGTVNMTGGQAGLYAGWKQDSFHIEALAEGGLNSYTTQRTGLGGTAMGSGQGQQYSGELSVGYDIPFDQAEVEPFLSGQYTLVDLGSFEETGSLAPLSFGAQNEGYLNSDLGATASRKWDLGGFALSPMVSAAWEHVYQGNLDSLVAGFSGGGNFTVYGPATGTDAAVLGAGVRALFGKNFNVYAQYQGKLGLTNYTQQNVSGGVNLGF